MHCLEKIKISSSLFHLFLSGVCTVKKQSKKHDNGGRCFIQFNTLEKHKGQVTGKQHLQKNSQHKQTANTTITVTASFSTVLQVYQLTTALRIQPEDDPSRSTCSKSKDDSTRSKSKDDSTHSKSIKHSRSEHGAIYSLPDSP
ncbi:hypothetical protein AVEN_7675-1 [Araneus ventricosus]|uniref:Uncharacterized protein n=1 Tax=Araneus ventricosus TaxID=182803 RepID=A0A4Y2S2P4_ARAVE|nr:hypothetical protein AVEN_7675-1 [Araneus ventricosus]